MASSDGRDRDESTSANTPSKENPFIRFKQSVDKNVGSLLQGIIGLPSAFSKQSGNTRWAEFDEDLKRRDELQARRNELKDSEARRLQGVAAEEEVEIPVKKSGTAARNGGIPPDYGQTDDDTTRDLPLYSPITPSLFAHLNLPRGSAENWGRAFRIYGPDDDHVPLFSSLLLTPQPLESHTDTMRGIQYMAHNILRRAPSYHSDSSLLPYVLFSPYSPIRLSIKACQDSLSTGSRQDTFPYCDAFEDLLLTGQQPSSHAKRFDWRTGPALRIDHPLYYNFYGLQWIDKLQYLGLLNRQSSNTDSVSTADALPREPETEADMYEHLMRWGSSPEGAVSAIASLAGEAASSIEKQFKALEETLEENLAASSLQRRLEEFEGTFKKTFEKNLRESSETSDELSQTNSNQSRVVSTNRSVRHTTHEDGTVETTVWEWRKYADGRETETETVTSHLEERVFQRSSFPQEEAKKGEVASKTEEQSPHKKSQTEKKGWFWN